MIVKLGEQWRLKSNWSKIATVIEVVNYTAQTAYHPNTVSDTAYVVLRMPWIKSGKQGKAIDTLCKYYEKQP